jgi:CheY-like chemotaxis protein
VTPTILVVDDDVASLAVLSDELRTGYGRGYRVVSDSSSAEALKHLGALAEAGEEVALILARPVDATYVRSGAARHGAPHQPHGVARPAYPMG